MLAGVYEPTFGSMSIDGRLSSFTDITLGMDPEATGLENIIFRCVFMGLSFAEARRLSPSIQEFSELGEFLRLPVRTYSTGMFLRLAFAISTSIEPDIIIMDEMIAGGDARFIEKAKARLTNLLERTKILVLATHGVEIMESLCNKVVWLDHGEVRKGRLVRGSSSALSCGISRARRAIGLLPLMLPRVVMPRVASRGFSVIGRQPRTAGPPALAQFDLPFLPGMFVGVPSEGYMV